MSRPSTSWPTDRRFHHGLGALVVGLALATPLPPPSAGVGQAASGGPGPDERAVLDELNLRRRAAGAPALAWDGVAYAALRDADVGAVAFQAQAADALSARVNARRGFSIAWTTVVYHAADRDRAVQGALDADLFERRYTHGAARVAETTRAGAPRTVVAIYVGAMPPRLGRASLNGPAGGYRVRCPACGRERVYRLPAPRGHLSIDCPSCRTLMTPHIEDTRGALHWPTWYARPYEPFALDNPFLAWKWVNEGVLYDHRKADRDLPGWQTAAETARLKTGVCRDTAVLLAAWLRAQGRAAHVVTGRHGGAAHAWVVLSEGETRYLLETAMDGPLNRRYPPRLELASDYLPTEMMFDERRVLLNRGQQPTRDYDSPRVWFATEEPP